MRRRGARRNVSTRIRLTFKGVPLEAWVLNVSRGGMRLLLDSPLAEGDEFEAEVPLGDELEGEAIRRPVRVVWADRQVDGTIAGVEFLDVRPSVRMPVARDLSVDADGAAGAFGGPLVAPLAGYGLGAGADKISAPGGADGASGARPTGATDTARSNDATDGVGAADSVDTAGATDVAGATGATGGRAEPVTLVPPGPSSAPAGRRA
jgi:hypothetical protein